MGPARHKIVKAFGMAHGNNGGCRNIPFLSVSKIHGHYDILIWDWVGYYYTPCTREGSLALSAHSTPSAVFTHFLPQKSTLLSMYILGGAATCSEGFVICFLKVPFACLGSMAAAVAWGTFRKHFTKPSEQVAAPPSIYHSTPLIQLEIQGPPHYRLFIISVTDISKR